MYRSTLPRMVLAPAFKRPPRVWWSQWRRTGRLQSVAVSLDLLLNLRAAVFSGNGLQRWPSPSHQVRSIVHRVSGLRRIGPSRSFASLSTYVAVGRKKRSTVLFLKSLYASILSCTSVSRRRSRPTDCRELEFVESPDAKVGVEPMPTDTFLAQTAWKSRDPHAANMRRTACVHEWFANRACRAPSQTFPSSRVSALRSSLLDKAWDPRWSHEPIRSLFFRRWVGASSRTPVF